MKKHLLEEFKKILDNEKDLKDVKLYINICGEWCISYWCDDVQYYLSINEIFRSKEA